MGDIFSGLESMGLGSLSNMSIYDEDKKESHSGNGGSKPQERVMSEADYIFDKKMQCPVCNSEFKVKAVKTGKARLIGSDSDLRPKYAGIDSIKYDAIVCPNCGYAALSRFFSYMTSIQARFIREGITAHFKKLPETGDIYTYDEAISRYKLALLNSVVKKAKNSERAYTCLKIAWLYRGKKENLPADTPNYNAVKVECDKNELEMINNAYAGFLTSRDKEDYPICGMDEATFDYLIADLANRVGQYEISEKMAATVIMSRAASGRIKEKARDLREEVKKKLAKKA